MRLTFIFLPVWFLLSWQPAVAQECCSYKSDSTRCVPCRPTRRI